VKIVVALDSFKGSLTAVQACDIVADAIRATVPGARLVTKPMADGGEGTASVLMAAAGGRWIGQRVMGPLPEMEVDAGFVWLPHAPDVPQTPDRESAGAAAQDSGAGFFVSGASRPRIVGRMPAPRVPGSGPSAAPSGSQPQPAGALVEMATASGLPLLRPEQRNPLKTTTYGTGQLIAAALTHGATHILLAIGGSATVDGGVGAAMALGWRFLTQDGQDIGLGGGQLPRIARIVPPICTVPVRASRGMGILPMNHRQDADATGSHGRDGRATHGRDTRAAEASHGVPGNVAVEVLCDVDNPLCGAHGAARVFGPQKGATPEMVEQLDAGLAHLAGIVKEQLGCDIAELPGAGAAGGLAAGAVAFLGARLVPGIDAVMSQVRLAEAVTDADWVITGEGSFDEQSLRGKVVSGVLRVARAAGAKVAVCAGQVHLEPQTYRKAGIETAVACMQAGMELDYALAHSEELLNGAARRFSRECLSAPT
jgi:glycerate kinase